jgi:hypothetical protein
VGTLEKGGQGNDLHDGIRGNDGDGDDAVHAEDTVPRYPMPGRGFLAIGKQWRQEPSHELGRGHRQQRQAGTSNSVELTRAIQSLAPDINHS